MEKKLIKNTLIIGVGRISTQFMVLLLLPLYTTFLSPSEYGIGDMVITYAILAMPFVTLSLEQGAFRLLIDSRDDETRKTAIISYVARTIFILSLVLGLAVLIGGYLFNAYIVGVALLYAISAIYLNASIWIARGLGDNSAYSKGSVIVGAFSLVLSITFIAIYGMGTNGMLLALTIANIAGVIYFFLRLHLGKYIKLKHIDNAVSKPLLGYSLPLVPNSISWWLINAADRTIIMIFLGAAATGIYSVAVKFPAILIGLFSIFWIAWHEAASVHINHKDRDAFFSEVTNNTITLFGSLALVIIAGLAVSFKYIVGSEFDDSYNYVPILMFGALCSCIITLYGSIYAAKKQTRQILNTTLLAASINIILMLALTPFIGLFGAAIATAVAYFSMVIYRHHDIKKFVKIKIDMKKVVILLGISSVVVFAYYLNNPVLNIINLTTVIIYAMLLNKRIISTIRSLLWGKIKKY